MLTMHINFNLCYIDHSRANRHSNFLLKELKNLIDPPRTTSENVCAINILQNSTRSLRS